MVASTLNDSLGYLEYLNELEMFSENRHAVS